MPSRWFRAIDVRRGVEIVTAAAVVWAVSGCHDATGPGWQNLHIESGLADTLYQRSLLLHVSASGVSDVRGIDLVIDPGTPSELHAVGFNPCLAYIYPQDEACDWQIAVLDTLANGPHRLVLQLSDATGVVATREADVVIYVAAVPYTLTPLPGLGGTNSAALDVNASGLIAGWAADAAGIQHAVTWQDGAITVLPTNASARSSLAVAVNAAGDVVGGVVDTVGTAYCERGIRWSSGTWRYEGVLGRSVPWNVPAPSYCSQRVIAINASGAMLIRAPEAFGYDDETAWLDQMGAVITFTGVKPLAMNDLGQVIGRHTNGLYDFPWAWGVAIPNTPGHHAVHYSPTLIGINARSQLLVDSFLATPGEPLLDLFPFLGGFSGSVQVPDNGTVLAFDWRAYGAILWRAGRTMRVALTPQGWRLDGITRMNDAGMIVGHAKETSTGRTSAVVLRPTP